MRTITFVLSGTFQRILGRGGGGVGNGRGLRWFAFDRRQNTRKKRFLPFVGSRTKRNLFNFRVVFV